MACVSRKPSYFILLPGLVSLVALARYWRKVSSFHVQPVLRSASEYSGPGRLAACRPNTAKSDGPFLCRPSLTLWHSEHSAENTFAPVFASPPASAGKTAPADRR